MVVVNGNIVSIAHNRWRNYNIATADIDIDHLTYHAEYRAIVMAGINNCKGATIVVARVTNRGAKMSKPCPKCEALIRRVGIKKVIYSTDDM